ncbi:MAG: hypothetical protein EBR07_07930 [Planctomycetes bacterium]|nr:hypothetical protein [Planctomycetota bacterium]
MSKKPIKPTIDKQINQIVAVVELLHRWHTVPWDIKKIWIMSAMNWLEDLRKLCDAEYVLEEMKEDACDL